LIFFNRSVITVLYVERTIAKIGIIVTLIKIVISVMESMCHTSHL
jgi:hypothetical protein